MDPRGSIFVRDFPEDRFILRTLATYKNLRYRNYYKVDKSEKHSHEVHDYRGRGEMFLTDQHFIFFTDKPYRYRDPRTGRPVPFSNPYLWFHRESLGYVNFANSEIRLDEVIFNPNGPDNFYGKYIFTIDYDFSGFATALNLVYNPNMPDFEFAVVPKLQSYYTSRYPMSWYNPHSCPRCGYLVHLVTEHNKYYCNKCREYL